MLSNVYNNINHNNLNESGIIGYSHKVSDCIEVVSKAVESGNYVEAEKKVVDLEHYLNSEVDYINKEVKTRPFIVDKLSFQLHRLKLKLQGKSLDVGCSSLIVKYNHMLQVFDDVTDGAIKNNTLQGKDIINLVNKYEL